MRWGRDVVAFKIIRGFLQIGVEKWAIVAKMPQLTSQPLDADLMVTKKRMANTPPSPTESFIGVGVDKHV